MGTVTMAAADHVMVKTAEGKEQRIAVTQGTKILRGTTVVKIDQLTPGIRVVVTLTRKPTVAAAEIRLGGSSSDGTKK